MQKVKIGDIADFQKGFAFKSKDYQDNGVRIIRVTNLNKNDFSDANSLYIADEKAVQYERYSLRFNDAVISTVGSWPTNPDSVVGKVCIIPKGLDGSLLNQNAVRLRAKDGCKQVFLNYVLRNQSFSKYIVGTAQGSANQASITLEDIRSYEFPLPSIDIQDRITSILDNLDQKITTNAEINQNLLQQASALFDNTLQQSNSVSYVDLGSLGDVKGGKRLPKGVNLITEPNSHPYIRVRDLNNVVFASLSSDYEYVDDETQKSISRYITSSGDVLISIVGTIGLTAIVDSSLNNANLTENCVKVTNLNGISPEYLLLYLRSSLGNEAISKGIVGAVQQKLPIKNIQSIPVPMLPSSELESLNVTLHAIFKQLSVNVTESKCLSATRDLLLPKLMSGDLDVSEMKI